MLIECTLTVTPHPSQGQTTGYIPGASSMPSHNPAVNPWIFNQNLGAVLHMHGTCIQCNTTMLHLMMAFLANDSSYTTATTECNKYFQHAAGGQLTSGEDTLSLHCQIGELTAQLAHVQTSNSIRKNTYSPGSLETPPKS